jgi:hypothetical protein
MLYITLTTTVTVVGPLSCVLQQKSWMEIDKTIILEGSYILTVSIPTSSVYTSQRGVPLKDTKYTHWLDMMCAAPILKYWPRLASLT